MNNQKTFMLVLTSIVLLIAGYGIYVEKSIKASATTILVDRLEPVPLISHRFDYYGTTVKESFSSDIVNYEQLLANRSQIQKVKEQTEKEWNQYKATYLTPDEARLVEHAQKGMDNADALINTLLEKAVTDRPAVDSILKTGILRTTIDPVLDDTNALLELQTTVGKQETVKMIDLLKNFSNFMIGALALAIVLLGSIVYPMIKKPRPQPKTRRKAPAKKPVAKKTTTTTRRAVKK
jgi:predicted membrane protein